MTITAISHRPNVLQSMNAFAKKYLVAGVAHAADMIASDTITSMTDFQALNIIVTVISVLALFGFYLLVYTPMVNRLDKDIKNIRLLLLLFPDEVVSE